MSESHDPYADEYRTDWDKKPFPKSDKSIIAEGVADEFFTGAGKNVEPAEIGAKGLDGFDSHVPVEGVDTVQEVPPDRVPPANQRSNVDEEFFTGTGEGIEPPEIGSKGQEGFDEPYGGKSKRTMPYEERIKRL